jgi:hypothetical protein
VSSIPFHVTLLMTWLWNWAWRFSSVTQATL